MNEVMIQLMSHVERIVRPVRALQSRKLRMRRELLVHLQSAFDEERAQGVDESTALGLAKKRLGEPAELTASLQKSIPWIQRTLMAKIRVPGSVERWKSRHTRIYGLEQPLTMAHMSILAFAASFVPYAALVFAVLVTQPKVLLEARFDRPTAILSLDAIVLVVALTSIFVSGRVISAMSAQVVRLSGFRAARFATLVVTSPLIVVIATVTLGLQRSPTAGEIARGFITGVVLLGLLILTGRLIAHLRGPYDDWLTLDIGA